MQLKKMAYLEVPAIKLPKDNITISTKNNHEKATIKKIRRVIMSSSSNCEVQAEKQFLSCRISAATLNRDAIPDTRLQLFLNK